MLSWACFHSFHIFVTLTPQPVHLPFITTAVGSGTTTLTLTVAWLPWLPDNEMHKMKICQNDVLMPGLYFKILQSVKLGGLRSGKRLRV